jgi:lipopolysaccharide transport system permease protein
MNVNQDTIRSKYSSVVEARTGWFDIHLSELWRYRDLIMLFVRRDFVAIYKQTVLGPLWFLLQPLFSTVVFTIIFGKVARIPTDGLPPVLFYMAGIVTWNYFAACLTKTSDTFAANASIFGKVYFPRLTIPISVIITNLITFSIQFCLFLMLVLYYSLSGAEIRPNAMMLVMPVLLLQMAALGLGFGIVVSSLTTKYRDLTYVVGFGVQLWMYATPVVYPLSQIPQHWRWLYSLNPMVAVVETFRYAFLGEGMVDVGQYSIGVVMTLAVLTIGILLFSRIEKTFMDTV